jgi:hypothetical protein
MPTPSLRELQGLFWRSIAGPPHGLGLAPALLEVAEPSATLDPAARLRVYADAYFWRLRDVLAEDFPRVAAILGPERFEDLVREYLRGHPSEHPSVRYLGHDLAAVVAQHADLPPYLADLGRLEWARLEVFDAFDCEPLTADALRAVRSEDWPQLRFAPIPALAVLRADWPVHEVWGGTDAASLASAPTVIRVWRAQDYRVYHAPMDARDAEALDRLMAGEPFEIVCTAFDDLPPLEGAQRATALLARWLEDGIIARVV